MARGHELSIVVWVELPPCLHLINDYRWNLRRRPWFFQALQVSYQEVVWEGRFLRYTIKVSLTSRKDQGDLERKGKDRGWDGKQESLPEKEKLDFINSIEIKIDVFREPSFKSTTKAGLKES